MGRIDLGGEWRAAPADEDLRRAYPDPSFDDGGWSRLPVPAHWQSHADFASVQGPVLYRRHFDAPRPAQGRRAWLRLDGVFYQSDIWLDGTYVGDTEGWFAPSVLEITDALRGRAEHLMAIEVGCDAVTDPAAKRNVTGLFQDWDPLEPGWNPGGIWRDIGITETGPVRIASLRTRCTDASDESATVQFSATLDAAHATTVALRTTVGGTEHADERQLAVGSNALEWQVVVERPALWWPHALGDQPRHDVVVEASVDGASSDWRAFAIGLRQVRMKDWVLSVNGERLFLKGSNYGPTRAALAEAVPSEIEHDVLLARRANLDLLRVQAHVARPELYEAADRHGLLLWQDLPLQGGYARSVRKAATRAAVAAVELLAHHPSIALWCGHSDSSISNTMLDASVKRAFERADGSRPVLAHAPVRRQTADLAGLAAKLPRLVRFVSALGADSSASEAQQAAEVRTQVEVLRRLKYRPTGGFCQELFADPRPVASASVLDHRRVPKLAYEAMAAACALVIVVADEPEPSYRPGARISLDVHVVSDLRVALEGALVTAELTGGPIRGPLSWAWAGDIGADACERVGVVTFLAPEGPADLMLQLNLDHDAAKAARHYQILVTE